MPRYAVRLSYKGTDYHGWQIQNNAKTIQGELENAFSLLLKDKIALVGCGRTDTGVHAIDYYAYFNYEKEELASPILEKLIHKLNGYLPKDIAIHEILEVKSDWHSRFDAKSRTYEYKVNTEKTPFLDKSSYYVPNFPVPITIGIKKMNEAAQLLIGKKDFECFSKSKTEVNNFMCDITRAEWVKTETGYSFFITANRFLRNMVRAIVGTLLEIGFGKREIEDLERILDSKSRSEAGYSVPAHGLYLIEVKYDWD